MVNKDILITGANGFVGRALVNACSARLQKNVIAVTRRPFNFNLPYVENYPHHGLQSMLDGVGVLVHAAARVHVMQDKSSDPLAEFRAVNTRATLELAAAAARSGVKRFIFISTAKVNGEETPAGEPFTEADTPKPVDPYAISKWEAEQGLMEITRQTGMEVVIIRPPLVYGSGVQANFAALMHAVKRGIPLPFGAIQNSRSLVGIDNLMDFIVTCISHPGAANQIFLVSDGQDVSTSKLVRTMADAFRVTDRQFALPLFYLQWMGKILGKSAAIDRLCGNLQLDISKARVLLSWVPPVPLELGIRRALVLDEITERV
jgi:nucleoside-diphosphate-sugar epimerase